VGRFADDGGGLERSAKGERITLISHVPFRPHCTRPPQHPGRTLPARPGPLPCQGAPIARGGSANDLGPRSSRPHPRGMTSASADVPSLVRARSGEPGACAACPTRARHPGSLPSPRHRAAIAARPLVPGPLRLARRIRCLAGLPQGTASAW
jgi:hypothetical protein